MNYREFKEKVKEAFEKEFEHVDFREITKTNVTKDGISVRMPSGICPTIYIDDFYDYYVESKIRFEDVLDKMISSVENGIKNQELVATTKDSFLNHSIDDSIVFSLINTATNEEMLKNMPHREFRDLSIIYKFIIDDNKYGISCKITNDIAELKDLTEEKLFDLAKENTKRLFPPTVKTMADALKEILMAQGCPEEFLTDYIPSEVEENEMYIISNSSGINGAVSMLYEDCLYNLATKLDSDLYIMPSSIHEVIAIQANSALVRTPDALSQMVTEINMTHVEAEERLSNQVYYYDKGLRKLTLATDTPNKALVTEKESKHKKDKCER